VASEIADALDARDYACATVAGLRLTSLNAREHWRAKAARVKRERHATTVALWTQVGRACPLPPPLVVTITRVAPRALDDDNAVGAAKHVRDAVAAWLAIDDRDPRVTYVVRQERGPVAVRIEIRGAAAATGGER
jgi:hypothetical protein